MEAYALPERVGRFFFKPRTDMLFRIVEVKDVEGTYYSTYRYRIEQKKWWQLFWKYTGLSFTNKTHAVHYLNHLEKANS